MNQLEPTASFGRNGAIKKAARMKASSSIGPVLGVFAIGLAIGSLVSRSMQTSDTVASLRPETSIAPREGGAGADGPADFGSSHSWAGQPKDLQSRMKSLLEIGNPSERKRAVAEIADDLNPGEIKAALAQLKGAHLADHDDILVALISRWAELDPSAAFEYSTGLDGDRAAGALLAAVTCWASLDPDSAEARVAAMPRGSVKECAICGAIDGLAENDPLRAFAFLVRNSETKSHFAVGDFFRIWSTNDPVGAAAHVMELPPGPQRRLALGEVAQHWAEVNVTDALAWAQSLSGTNSAGVQSDPHDNSAVMSRILQTWLNANPADAGQWLDRLPDDSAKTDLLGSLTRSVSEENPQLAVDLAVKLPAGKTQDGALRDIIRNWSEADFTGALAWAQGQSDAGVREIVLPPLIPQLASQNPEGAMALALTLGDGAQQSAVKNALSTWTSDAPAAAAAWVDAQPVNPEYSDRVAAIWAHQDLAAAGQWVSAMPNGPAKDGILVHVAAEIAGSQPAATVSWIAAISDEQQRNNAYMDLASRWLTTQPQEARAWITGSPLPQDLRDKLLATPQ